MTGVGNDGGVGVDEIQIGAGDPGAPTPQQLANWLSLEQSYDSWRYGEEASLYSIAEDSREEWNSELASRCGTDCGGENSNRDLVGFVYNCEPHRAPPQTTERAETKIEVQWGAGAPPPHKYRGEEETRSSNGESHDDVLLGIEVCSSSLDSSEDARNKRRRRRFLVLGFLAGAVLIAVLLGVLISRSNQTDDGRDASVTSLVEKGDSPSTTKDDGDSGITLTTIKATTAPSSNVNHTESAASNDGEEDDQPTPSPSSLSNNPNAADNLALLHAFVKSSIDYCADTSILQNTSSLQYQVFQELLQHVKAESTVNEQGFLEVPVDLGYGAIAELYGLAMLFYSTGGETDWYSTQNWLSLLSPSRDTLATSVCDLHGVGQCVQRSEGSCQVEELTLHANNLVGDVPREVCCLLCLNSLDLSDNKLTSLPSCVIDMMETHYLNVTGNPDLILPSSSTSSSGNTRP